MIPTDVARDVTATNSGTETLKVDGTTNQGDLSLEEVSSLHSREEMVGLAGDNGTRVTMETGPITIDTTHHLPITRAITETDMDHLVEEVVVVTLTTIMAIHMVAALCYVLLICHPTDSILRTLC